MITFSKNELVRYSRQLMVPEIGLSGQKKLKAAKILVIGAGGLGCPVLQYLTAAGVGTLGIVDFDTIELHNLHRQILYAEDDLGKLKVETAVEKLQKQNPHVHFQPYPVMLDSGNASTILQLFDLIIDGSDNFETRYLVNDTCVKLNKPLVYGSIFKFEGQVAVFNYKGSKQLRDVYEQAPAPEEVPNCSETGVIGAVPGVIGMLMCTMALEVTLDHFKEVNTLHIFNFKNFSMTSLLF